MSEALEAEQVQRTLVGGFSSRVVMQEDMFADVLDMCWTHTDWWCHRQPQRWSSLRDAAPSKVKRIQRRTFHLVGVFLERSLTLGWETLHPVDTIQVSHSPSERRRDLTHSSGREGVEVGHVWAGVLSWHSWKKITEQRSTTFK